MATVLKRLSNSAKKYHSLIQRKSVTIKATLTAMRKSPRRVGTQTRNPKGSSNRLGRAITAESNELNPIIKADPAREQGMSAKRPDPSTRRHSTAPKPAGANRTQSTALKTCQTMSSITLRPRGNRTKGHKPWCFAEGGGLINELLYVGCVTILKHISHTNSRFSQNSRGILCDENRTPGASAP